jgi:ribonuclease P protein component
VGLIVPRFDQSAVARNRMKRRLREAIRLELLPQTPPLDVVVRTSKGAYELSYAALRTEVVTLLTLLGRMPIS